MLRTLALAFHRNRWGPVAFRGGMTRMLSANDVGWDETKTRAA